MHSTQDTEMLIWFVSEHLSTLGSGDRRQQLVSAGFPPPVRKGCTSHSAALGHSRVCLRCTRRGKKDTCRLPAVVNHGVTVLRMS